MRPESTPSKVTSSAPDTERRVLLAFALQPVSCAAFSFALFPLLSRAAGAWGRTVDPLQAAVIFAILAGVVGGLIAGVVAYPMFSFLNKRGAVTLAQTLASGIACGAVPAVLVVLIQVVSNGGGVRGVLEAATSVARLGAFGVAVGVACSAVFWVVAVRHAASPSDERFPTALD